VCDRTQTIVHTPKTPQKPKQRYTLYKLSNTGDLTMTTGIEWTDKTWNTVTGCDKISPGTGCSDRRVPENFY
jgi:hypothetical protein